jgi:hypothetical protein
MQYREVFTMSNEQRNEPTVREVTEAIEIEEFVADRQTRHRDQHPHYSHELPDEVSEATSRALVRVVPLAYGMLLGGLSGNMLLGLAAGGALSGAFDLSMGEDSMVRGLGRTLSNRLCPAVAAAAHRLAAALEGLGLGAPALLRGMRCRSGL